MVSIEIFRNMFRRDTLKKVTLNDIAARLNLSKSLVSRALLNKYGVSEDTRQLIIQTAREMNYSSPKWNPNMTKPSHGTKYVCLLALREDFSDSNYYANIIENIENWLERRKAYLAPHDKAELIRLMYSKICNESMETANEKIKDFIDIYDELRKVN